MLELTTCFASLILVTAAVAAQTRPTDLGQAVAVKQIWFGDAEGNPKDWPEPIFSDGFTPWREIASNFDAVVFDSKPNALGDVAFHKAPWNEVNLPRGVPGFGLDAYYGTNRPLPPDSLEAIVAMGAILGGTLAGIDYAEPRVPDQPENLVRLTKKWFSNDVGAGVFLNAVHSHGGGAWWYDVFPNILACQLAGLYRDRADGTGEPTLSELCEKSIDRWHEVADYLRNGSDVPEFAFKAVQLVDGPVAGSTNLTATRFQPIAACNTGKPGYQVVAVARRPDPRQVCFGHPHYNGDIFQSDVAGAFAYLGMLGFEKAHAAKDRQLAEWSLTFLDRADYNPTRDNLLPFGALAAARMNAEYGDKHDLQKILGWVFSATSAVRPRWGMIGKAWGGSPVFGLVGSRKTGRDVSNPLGPDYAFALETMSCAATIAPIPRYDPPTATAIGKYLDHVAHNARFFYPAYLKYMDPVTEKYIADAKSPILKLSLPFEGLKSSFREQVENAPFGTGDALKPKKNANNGAFRTDLGVYSGVYAGALARILLPTAVDNIYQVDLLGDDMPAPAAFPTYLIYNPYDETKSVPLRIDAIRSAGPNFATGEFYLYDAVDKAIVARHVTTSASVEIAPHRAEVLVAVPQSENLETDGPLLTARPSGIIVDFSGKGY